MMMTSRLFFLRNTCRILRWRPNQRLPGACKEVKFVALSRLLLKSHTEKLYRLAWFWNSQPCIGWIIWSLVRSTYSFNKSWKLCVALRNLFVAPRLLLETLYTPNVSAVRQIGQSWLAELSGYTSRIIISRLRQTKLQAQPVNNATLTELYMTYYAVGRPFFHPRMAA